VEVRLDQVNIVVQDMDAMAAFYARLGVEVRSTPPQWAAHHRSTGPSDPHQRSADNFAGADLGLDSEQFARVWDQGWPGGPGIVLGFRVPDRDAVDRLFHELTSAGHGAQQAPYDAFWGARYAVVSDPDGNAIGIMSPAEEERRTPPPPPPT
jgi:catechol 2,3-dioxygenase-like lactoylglutathione lyase family enzyme